MKRLFGINALVIMMLLISGCSAAATPAPALGHLTNQSSAGIPAQPPAVVAPGTDLAGPGAKSAIGAADSTTTSTSAAAADRIVIKNADLKLVVKDPAASMDFITNLAVKMGGYVVSSNLYKTTTDKGTEVPEATITIRVTAAQLDAALTAIKGQVGNAQTDVLSENVTGQDVTKEYTDLSSQLVNLQKAEAQLQEIMASATKTEDVLAVYNQLIQIRSQIEVIQGQINYYKESAQLSAINVTLVAQASVQPLQIGGWQPEGVARNAVQALINTMQFLGSAVIWIIIYLLPTLIVIGLILFVVFLILRAIWRGLRRVTKNNRQPSAAIPPVQPPAKQ
jgi:hypothetical protein